MTFIWELDDKREHIFRCAIPLLLTFGYHFVEIDLVVGAQHTDDKRFFNEIRILSV